MRVVPFVVSAWLLAGCDGAWDLEHIDDPMPGDCAEAIGHDEDRDGVDDRCDPCSFDTRNSGDADDDGIADACDPEPTVGNELVLFSGFDEITRSQFTVNDGGFGDDAFRITGAGTQSMLWNADPSGIALIAGIDVDAIEDTPYREIGVVFDAVVTTQNELNGVYCVLGRDPSQIDYLEVFRRIRPLGDDLGNHTNVDLPLTPLHGLMRASYVRNGTPAASCTFVASGEEKTVSGSPTTMPASGKLALFGDDMTAAFRFVLVVRRR